jgi:hypothetical protein
MPTFEATRGARSTTAVMGDALLYLLLLQPHQQRHSSQPLAPAVPWQHCSQPQLQPNQGPAGSSAPAGADADPIDPDEDDLGGIDLGGSDENLDPAAPSEPSSADAGSSDSDDRPAASTSCADPLRAERRSNQLEKELRKARAQLSRFSEISPMSTPACRTPNASGKSSSARWPIVSESSTRPTAAACAAWRCNGTRPARSQVLILRKGRLIECRFS